MLGAMTRPPGTWQTIGYRCVSGRRTARVWGHTYRWRCREATLGCRCQWREGVGAVTSTTPESVTGLASQQQDWRAIFGPDTSPC